jgi:ubiquitin-activating enzyme E1
MKDKEYDPILMGKIKAIPYGFTSWDSIVVRGPKTLQQFIDFFKQEY